MSLSERYVLIFPAFVFFGFHPAGGRPKRILLKSFCGSFGSLVLDNLYHELSSLVSFSVLSSDSDSEDDSSITLLSKLSSSSESESESLSESFTFAIRASISSSESESESESSSVDFFETESPILCI